MGAGPPGNAVAGPGPAVDHRPVDTVEIRLLEKADAVVIAEAFAALGWPGKTVAQYERYLADQEAGRRLIFVATLGEVFAGYVTVEWISGYRPFREQSIPEITDLNVLPPYRRRHVATALVDAAEAAIAERSQTAGIGVGLYADYGAAHLMYLARGYRPDGRGITYQAETVAPGTTVRVDDDLVLMMSRQLGKAAAS